MAHAKLLARSPFRPVFSGEPFDDVCIPIRPKHYGTFIDADTIGKLQGLLAEHPQASPDHELAAAAQEGLIGGSQDGAQQQQHREVEAESAEPEEMMLELQRRLREWRATALHNERFNRFFEARAAAAQQRTEQLERDLADLEHDYDDLRRDHDDLGVGYGRLWRDYEDLGHEFEQLQLRFEDLGDDYRNLQQSYEDLGQIYQQIIRKDEESEREAARLREGLDLILAERDTTLWNTNQFHPGTQAF